MVHTKINCSILGTQLTNLFDLIIDSGGCENIIGQKTVKKLRLTIKKHPNPYIIGWIKAVDDVKITKRYKVPFSIGKYKDEVYCKIVDKDNCNLIFGRPWQFDVDARHESRENIYKLSKRWSEIYAINFPRKFSQNL